ncbi:MAG: ComEC/Rec2 family competence protein [Candidatus Nanopelagicales bacterium]|nr:ComEC/Rec2 family competence protein [Candidatus Nanopelagicales bacterium]MDZ4250476.1 ComEC/Rec2 family competence protein [Candidatus Nanopelagicales bacterium]
MTTDQAGVGNEVVGERRPGFNATLPTLAVAVWLSSASTYLWGWVGALAAGLVVGGLSGAILGRWRALRPAVAMAGVAVVAGVAVGGGAVSSLEQPVIAEAAASHADVLATLTTASETRNVAPAGAWQEAGVSLRGRLTAVRASRGQEWSLDAPVRILAPADSEWVGLPIGTVVEVRGKLLPRRVGDDSAATLRVSRSPQILSPVSGPAEWLHRVRQGLRDALAEQPAAPASLVAGLALGDESQQSPDFGDAMRDSGLSHLTAVSGGNTALVLLVGIGAARLARIPPGGQFAAGGIVLAGYVALVGPQPSVLRAAGMGCVALIGLWRGGALAGLPAMGTAVTLLLLISPGLSVSLGFSLSVAATIGLLVISPVMRRNAQRIPGAARVPSLAIDALCLTIGAQIATAPILLAMNGGVSVLAVPANVLAAPVVAPITLLGLGAAVISLASPELASGLGALAIPFSGWIANIAERTQELSKSGPGPALVVTVLLAAAAMAAWSRGPRLRATCHWTASVFSPRRCGSGESSDPRWAVIGLLACAAALVPAAVACGPLSRSSRAWPPDDWRVIVCDVGQGSAALLRTSDDGAVLVDAGPEDGGVAQCLSDALVKQLSGVVLSHFHADHVGGLEEVLEGWDTGQILVSPLREPEENASFVETVAKREGVPVRVARAGDEIHSGAVDARVLWPDGRDPGASSDPNNSSVVLLVRWPGVEPGSALLTGDIESGAQGSIIRAGAVPGGIDLVVIPHHGSANQHPRFASWTDAGMAAVSSGADNDYGHPADSALALYRRSGSQIARTDVAGAWAYTWRSGQVEAAPQG